MTGSTSTHRTDPAGLEWLAGRIGGSKTDPETAPGLRRMPGVGDDGRRGAIARVALLSLGQAGAAALAAFATRDAFAALRDGRVDAYMPFVLIALAGLAIAGFRMAERVAAERVGQHYAASLRLALFNHLSRLPARTIGSRRTGGLSLRFVGDLAAARGWVSLGIARLISAAIALPAACAVLLMLDLQLGLVVAPILLAGILFMFAVAPRLGPAHRRLRSRRARLAADMSERAPVAPRLRLMGRLPVERKLIRQRTEGLIDAALSRARGAGFLRAVPDAIAGLAAAVLLLGALRNGTPAPEAAGALAALGLTVTPLRDLAGVWDRRRAWVAARDKCARLLAERRLPRARAPRTKDVLRPSPELAFEAVPLANGRSFDLIVKPGETVALTGPNGAGKSTLLALAAGLESPEAGQVLIDGHPTVALSRKERQRLVVIDAATPILSGSLRRAFTMGAARRVPDETILATAREFGLSDVIRQAGGLDAGIVEGGRNLSAGERRRLLLARAKLSRPRLLLLDEPEDSVGEDICTLLGLVLSDGNATVLVATHDRRIIAMTDRAVALH